MEVHQDHHHKRKKNILESDDSGQPRFSKSNNYFSTSLFNDIPKVQFTLRQLNLTESLEIS